MKKGKMREDEDETRGRRERGIIIVYPKEEAELYNSTMETQWHPFYLSIRPRFSIPQTLCSPSSQTHLRTWKLCINITIVPLVAGWLLGYLSLWVNEFPPSAPIYWLILLGLDRCASKPLLPLRGNEDLDRRDIEKGWLGEDIEASVGFFIAGSLSLIISCL